MENISLAQLIKEKEECDKEIEDNFQRRLQEYKEYAKIDETFRQFEGELRKWVLNEFLETSWYYKLQATSLALSKGIEVAEAQKKIVLSIIDGWADKNYIENDNKYSIHGLEISNLKDLIAEQLEVKDE